MPNQAEEAGQLPPTHFIWVGQPIPEEHPRAGHDIAGPKAICAKLRRQGLTPNIYFWCLSEHVEYYLWMFFCTGVRVRDINAYIQSNCLENDAQAALETEYTELKKSLPKNYMSSPPLQTAPEGYNPPRRRRGRRGGGGGGGGGGGCRVNPVDMLRKRYEDHREMYLRSRWINRTQYLYRSFARRNIHHVMKAMLDYHLNPLRQSTRDHVSIKNIFSLYLLFSIGGYTIDTGVSPKPDTDINLSRLETPMAPAICPSLSVCCEPKIDLFMFYCPTDHRGHSFRSFIEQTLSRLWFQTYQTLSDYYPEQLPSGERSYNERPECGHKYAIDVEEVLKINTNKKQRLLLENMPSITRMGPRDCDRESFGGHSRRDPCTTLVCGMQFNCLLLNALQHYFARRGCSYSFRSTPGGLWPCPSVRRKIREITGTGLLKKFYNSHHGEHLVRLRRVHKQTDDATSEECRSPTTPSPP